MKIHTLCLPFWVPSFRCDSSLKLHAKFSKTDSLCFTWKAWLTNCFIILCAVFVRFTKYIILCTLSIKYYFLSHWELLWNSLKILFKWMCCSHQLFVCSLLNSPLFLVSSSEAYQYATHQTFNTPHFLLSLLNLVRTSFITFAIQWLCHGWFLFSFYVCLMSQFFRNSILTKCNWLHFYFTCGDHSEQFSIIIHTNQ